MRRKSLRFVSLLLLLVIALTACGQGTDNKKRCNRASKSGSQRRWKHK